MKNKNLFSPQGLRSFINSLRGETTRKDITIPSVSLRYPYRKMVVALLCLLTLGVGQVWANGGIGYKGVAFTKNGTVTGWYNIHDVSWSYYNSTYDCRASTSGVTTFNNADLGVVATLSLKKFVVIGWTDGGDFVAGQLKYRLYKQSATAGSYSTLNVGNYGSTSNTASAADVLATSGNDRVVGKNSLTTNIVTSSTAAGEYYLQLQGLGRMQWANNGSHGSFNENNGSEVKAKLTVPGFVTTSTSKDFGNLATGKNTSETISFTQHYGTTLKTSNCALSGSNTGDFSVTGISETGVTVTFTPQATGSRSATLTITDANSKKCTITLTGTGIAADTYSLTVKAGTGISEVTGSTDNITANQQISISATVKTGYTWEKWTKSGDGTLTTFTATTKDQTVKVGTAKDITLTASATENKYTITLTNATASSVSAGVDTKPSITAATAPFGMTFDKWTTTGGASVASKTSTTTTVSATADGTVTATYKQYLYAFVEGRFHVTNASRDGSWTNTFSSGDWNENSTTIKMDYDATNHRFYRNTYATPKELSTQISNFDPYFYFKTSTSSTLLTSVTSYWSSSSTTLTTAGTSGKKTLTSSGSLANANLRFNSTDESGYVILYFDGTSVWYELENLPATIASVDMPTRVPPMAAVTATPVMSVTGQVNKAYCWGLYSDAACTTPVAVDITSLGGGKITFDAPQTQGTYYLKLTVHADDACSSDVDDEEVTTLTVTTDNMVFFDNSAVQWSAVYVTLLTTSYWNSEKGTGANGYTSYPMIRIGKSNIYYYDYSGKSTSEYINFCDHDESGYGDFDACQAVYRGDFNSCATMFVPKKTITHYLNKHDNVQTAYYNNGYWMKYASDEAGITLRVWGSNSDHTDYPLTNDGKSRIYQAEVNLVTNNAPYGFKLNTCAGNWYGNGGTMTIDNCTGWEMETDKNNCGITMTASGVYTFTVTCGEDGRLVVSVDYPLAINDYRLLYKDNTMDHPHPSQIIRKSAGKLDTVAMYIRPEAAGVSLKIQQCTAVSPSITWKDVKDITSDATALSGLGKGNNVYNFYLEQEEDNIKVNKTDLYAGVYYIRTNCLDGGWKNYKTSSDNLMTYTEYAEQKNYGFNYYKAKWVGTEGTDVTYTIACYYSESLSDTLVADAGDSPLTAAQAKSLPHSANIRFGWDSKTNGLKRAYINGSTNVSDRYLVLKGVNNKIFDLNGNAFNIDGLNAGEVKFDDLNNWIYQADVKAQPTATAYLSAKYDAITQDFIGTSGEGETLIGGDPTDTKLYSMRITYDFKTNRLMATWIPDGEEIDDPIDLQADMLLLRHGQDAATQIFFGEGVKIENVKTIYGALQFDYDDMVGKMGSWNETAYTYLMYYVSFPFEVKVSEIFGAGVRGTNWIIQKYNGAKRAKIGWFAETSTFWETLPGDSVLHPYEGYLVLLDRISFNNGSSSIWANKKSGNSVYLYFPSSSSTIGTINTQDVEITVPAHVCTIDREFTQDITANGANDPANRNHKNTDSHWNVIGTPLFQNANASTVVLNDEVGGEKWQYYYEWDCTNNTLSAETTRPTVSTTAPEFKAMHSYYAQFAGTITFRGAAISQTVAARREAEQASYIVDLQLMKEDKRASRTFVELREGASDAFVLNEDMYMGGSSTTANLYTYADRYDVAANVMSLDNQVVPVGVSVKSAGMYRFTMPSEFTGTVTLVDNETGTRTNLAVSDYEVYLNKQTYNERFTLEINIRHITTNIEGVDYQDGEARKFIQDGVLYIFKDGRTYDAQGNRVE